MNVYRVKVMRGRTTPPVVLAIAAPSARRASVVASDIVRERESLPTSVTLLAEVLA